MLRHKDTTIISEVKDFFTSSEKATNTIFTILSSLKLSEKRLGIQSKNKKKPYGLSQKQLRERYSKKRDKSTPANQRKEEYFTTKIQSMIAMIRTAINKGLRFEYVLADSWFTCFELVKFIKTRRIDVHLVGMTKMGNTKYLFNR